MDEDKITHRVGGFMFVAWILGLSFLAIGTIMAFFSPFKSMAVLFASFIFFKLGANRV